MAEWSRSFPNGLNGPHVVGVTYIYRPNERLFYPQTLVPPSPVSPNRSQIGQNDWQDFGNHFQDCLPDSGVYFGSFQTEGSNCDVTVAIVDEKEAADMSGYLPRCGGGLQPRVVPDDPYSYDPLDSGITPMFSGIHIGEPAGRPYLGPGPLDMDIVKEERDMGPSYMDTMDSMHGLHHYSGMTPPPLGHTSPIMGPGGPSRARKNKEDKICGVCGDRALGYNFDAISCESCKAFFRRNAPKGLDYFKCPYDEKCKMDISNRRFCKRCRLRKCFEIGMRKEYILTEEEKARKRQKIEDNRYAKIRLRAATTGPGSQQPSSQSQSSPSANSMMNSPDGISPGGSTGEGSPYFDETSNMDGYSMAQGPPSFAPVDQHSKIDHTESSMMNHSSNNWDTWSQGESGYSQSMLHSMDSNGTCDGQLRILSPEENVLIEELLYAYQGSLEINMDKTINREEADSMADLVNIAEISVRRVIDMAKKIKAFKALPQADQISLLKGGSIELLILRSVITFDKEKQHFLDPCDREESAAMNLDQLRRAEGTSLFEDHMKFVTQLAVELKADQTTLILLLVISLFSPDRPNLLNKQLVGEEQHRYSMLLANYLESRYSYNEARAMYPKLLMKLTDIRNLNEEHSQVLLKVNPMVIQPLMQEVLDLRA